MGHNENVKRKTQNGIDRRQSAGWNRGTAECRQVNFV